MKKENRRYLIAHEYHANDTFTSNILCFKGDKVKLSSSTYDNLSVFRDGENIVILSTNKSLGYAGLEYFEVKNNSLQLYQDFFIQNAYEINDLKKSFFDYTALNQVKILMQWIN